MESPPAIDEQEYVMVLAQKPASVDDVLAISESMEIPSPTHTTESSASDDDFGDDMEHDLSAAMTACLMNAEDNRAEESDESEDDSVEMDSVPAAMPYLPALDASTEITKHDGYSEAISDAQQHLDSRLLAYSQYQQMVRTAITASRVRGRQRLTAIFCVLFMSTGPT